METGLIQKTDAGAPGDLCGQRWRGGQRKKSWPWFLLLIVWSLSVLLLVHPLLPFLSSSAFPLQKALLALMVLWIALAWLQALWQLVVFLCSMMPEADVRPSGIERDSWPSVAVLYTCMNDFSEAAATSCIAQSYPDFHVFILDDSEDESCKRQVDSFCSRYSGQTTLLRRPERHDFKAGNLNHALCLISQRYDFFAVADADGILPCDFLGKMLPYFDADGELGFVQARQQVRISESASAFAKDLGVMVDVYWSRIVRYANVFGFVMFHGHGAVLRTAVWEEIGGFPGAVAEDLAFSTRARERGYYGLIAHDVVCAEDFPACYAQFCRRQRKYVRGTLEHAYRWIWSFLCSPRVSWCEKMDRLLASMTMVSALPLLLFLIAVCLLFPLVFSGSSIQLDSRAGLFASARLANDGEAWLRSHAVLFMSAMCLLVPLLPVIVHLWRQPLKLCRYLTASIAVHLSLLGYECWDMFVLLVTRKNWFQPTGDHPSGDLMGSSREVVGVRSWLIFWAGCAACVLATCVIAPPLLPVVFAASTGFMARYMAWRHIGLQFALLLPSAALLVILIFCLRTVFALSWLTIPASILAL